MSFRQSWFEERLGHLFTEFEMSTRHSAQVQARDKLKSINFVKIIRHI